MPKYIGIYLLLTLVLISCNIKEDMSNCPGTILIDYTSYSNDILNEIEDDEQVNIYIFDVDSICIEIYTFSYGELRDIDFEFEVPIQYNGLNAVVWHGNDSPDYSDRRMVIGENYENYYLRLNYNIATTDFTRVPSPLWASELEPIEYCASKTRHRVYMTRIHTLFNVNLRQQYPDGSIVELDMDDYLTAIYAQNDVYHTDYSVSRQSHLIEFTNEDELEENTFLDWAHVGTLRITPEMYCSMQITPIDTPLTPISVQGSTEFDLVSFMLQSREDDDLDDSEITDERFLDLNKIWNVDFLLDPSYIALSLNINGWTIWFDDVDLN